MTAALDRLKAARATAYAALAIASDEASEIRRRLKPDHPDRRDAEGRVEAARKVLDAARAAWVDAMLADGVEPPARRPARVVPPSAQVALPLIGGGS